MPFLAKTTLDQKKYNSEKSRNKFDKNQYVTWNHKKLPDSNCLTIPIKNRSFAYKQNLPLNATQGLKVLSQLKIEVGTHGTTFYPWDMMMTNLCSNSATDAVHMPMKYIYTLNIGTRLKCENVCG